LFYHIAITVFFSGIFGTRWLSGSIFDVGEAIRQHKLSQNNSHHVYGTTTLRGVGCFCLLICMYLTLSQFKLKVMLMLFNTELM